MSSSWSERQRNSARLSDERAAAYNRAAAEPGAVEARRKEFLRSLPPKSRGLFRKAYEGNSPLAAIRAKCYDCTGGSAPEIAACTAVTCPLWRFRRGRRPRKGRK